MHAICLKFLGERVKVTFINGLTAEGILEDAGLTDEDIFTLKDDLKLVYFDATSVITFNSYK